MHKNEFVRSHALGNDYIVLDPDALSFPLTPAAVCRICDRNHGVGSDGVLAVTASSVADFGVRIYNPDGSEAEKSGNGLRIFSKFLYDHGFASGTSFDHSTFSRNRTRLLEHDVAREFFTRVVAQARGLQLLSDEHFTVDGTLVEAWASLKSFKRKDQGPQPPPDDPGNPTVNFHDRAHRHPTRAVCAPPGRMPQTPDCLVERSEFELAVPTD